MDHTNHGLVKLLEGIESPALLWPRDRLLLGLARLCDTRGIERLHTAVAASLAHGDDALGIRCLLALGELCREVECSEHLGVIGGHQSILRIITDERARNNKRNTAEVAEQPKSDEGVARDAASRGNDIPVDAASVSDLDEGDEDEVQSAAALVAARVVSSGCAFPMRASFAGESSALGRFPLRYDFAISDGGVPAGNSTLSCSVVGTTSGQGLGGQAYGGSEGPINSTSEMITILVRPVKERQHSQFDVGFQMWPAAVILSRWLCRNPGAIRGRRVLEVGAGLGLCGLAAAYMAATVTLSDFNPVVLKTLEANVALNARWSSTADGGGGGEGCDRRSARTDTEEWKSGRPIGGVEAAITSPGRVRVRHLDWDTLHVPEVCPSDPGKSRCYLPPVTGPLESSRNGERGDCDQTGCGEGEEGMRRVEQGDRFEVIIASDHICQTSDAEGTIRVLRTLLATGGHAYFVVAHPRTRFGVDALVPLLEDCPELDFTCEQVSDSYLLEGLEEAGYLAWLHVHVWRVDAQSDLPGAAGVAEAGADVLIVAG